MAKSPPLLAWETHLRQLADTAVPAGDARPAGAPHAFLAWVASTPAEGSVKEPRGTGIDDALWGALFDPAADPGALLGPAGPLADQSSAQTIEVWTERELSGLHALSRHSFGGPSGPGRPRLFEAARWHTRFTQPDNATNHPWAVHVFLQLAHETGDDSARLYAETLVHNCQTNLGVPDALSGLILLDAADALGDYSGRVPGSA